MTNLIITPLYTLHDDELEFFEDYEQKLNNSIMLGCYDNLNSAIEAIELQGFAFYSIGYNSINILEYNSLYRVFVGTTQD